ncbi:MAG: enolase C-terminal domain-like protein [Pyrinomonadaceae bacterium]
MRVAGGKIYVLGIPFVEAFAHSCKNRRFSDSFVVQLTAEDGTVGYGEGLARPYVTGETVAFSVDFVKNELFPAVVRKDFSPIKTGIDPVEALREVDESLHCRNDPAGIVPNAARAAVELALIDCLLQSRKLSLGAVLPPKRNFVTYSGAITGGSVERAVRHARHFRLFGVNQLKIKIGGEGDVDLVGAIRRAVGEGVSLRVDANGAFSVRAAIELAKRLKPYRIDAFEQPVPPGDPYDLARVRDSSPIPVMADESLVTLTDASELIESSACDLFNLRISKCGGLRQTLAIARLAERAGIGRQIGCQVGETAILSAAGRHLAAFSEGVDFVEGSYGDLLLTEDVGRTAVKFGYGGRAPVLRGVGLGVKVRCEVLEKYASSVIDLKKELVKYA